MAARLPITPAMKKRNGFTLIELLIVVVIIGILAAIAIPKFAATKGRAYTARLRSDLRNLAIAQEDYFYENSTYAGGTAPLDTSFVPSAGTTIQIVSAGPAGWSAKATSTLTPTTCAVFFNAAPVAPATADGVISCQ